MRKHIFKFFAIAIIAVISLSILTLPAFAFSETDNAWDGFLLTVGFLAAVIFILISGLFTAIFSIFQAIFTGSGDIFAIFIEYVQDVLSLFGL